MKKIGILLLLMAGVISCGRQPKQTNSINQKQENNMKHP